LALLALAAQIALSFGHVHYYGLGFAVAKTASAAVAQESDAAVLVKPVPAHKPDGSGSLDCAICALIQVAAHAAPAAAPELPVIAEVGSGTLHFSPAPILAASPHFLFQARAPPTN
jgi:hypothetical protein